MQVLLVTHRYPPLGVAGVERLSEQTALSLAARGHQVTVMTRNDTKAPPTPMLQSTVREGIPLRIVTGGGPTLGRFPRFAPLFDRMFERTLLEVDPDVVLVSHLINHSPNYVSIAHRWGVPVVLELHDFFMACERAHLERWGGDRCGGPEAGRACATYCFPNDWRSDERWALRTHIFRRALHQADALTCPSEFVAGYFREHYGTLPPLHVIGNGVEFDTTVTRTTPREGPLHLACVGTVGPHKGQHVVLEALRLAGLPNVRLSLFGEVNPGYYRRVAGLAEGLPNVEFKAYGRFAPRELPFLLEDVDAVIVPSLVWETYSIAAREALACGVPVLASRLGALTEAVRHGGNGLLFEPGSALDLATVLQMLDSDRRLLEGLRTGIKESDWVSVVERIDRLEAVLEETIAANATASRSVAEQDELVLLRDFFLETVR